MQHELVQRARLRVFSSWVAALLLYTFVAIILWNKVDLRLYLFTVITEGIGIGSAITLCCLLRRQIGW